MASKTEPAILSDGIKWEQKNGYSRKVVTIKEGVSLLMLAVVSAILRVVPATGTAKTGGNTGAGTCASVTGGAETKIGTYILTCIAAATGGGTFSVRDPLGNLLPNATVGVAYTNPQLNFTIADGDPDFIVGDGFTIAVTAGSGQFVELDPDAVDGSEDAAGILIDAVDATAAATKGVIVERDAMVALDNLVWPTGITSGEKAIAIAKLDALGIKAVTLA